MVKYIYQAVALVFIFAGALFLFGRNMETDMEEKGVTEAITDETYPYLQLQTQGQTVNVLYGYSAPLEANVVRESITPINQNRQISLLISKAKSRLVNVTYSIVDKESGEVYKTGSVNAIGQNQRRVDLTFDYGFKTSTEYILDLKTTSDKGKTIHYYTRLKYYLDESNLAKKLAFAQKFHNNTFSKNKSEEISRYLEPDGKNRNSTLAYVDITSDASLVTWAEMSPKIVSDEFVTIKEYNMETACIQYNYFVQATTASGKETYHIKEFYRVRYASGRDYLLNFSRSMEAVFDVSTASSKSSQLKLGITEQNNGKMLSNKKDDKLYFSRDGFVYQYDMKTNQVKKIYASFSEKASYAYRAYNEQGIRLLKVDDKDNLYFCAYGYFARGSYEGDVAVVLYEYTADGTLEEMVYMPINTTYQQLKEDFADYGYVSSRGIYYFTVANTVYAYNMTAKRLEKIAENVKEDNMVYGYMHKSDVGTMADGTKVTPCYELYIANTKGEVRRKYSVKNQYIQKINCNGNVINMTLCKRQGSHYVMSGEDTILNNSSKDEPKFSYVSRVTTKSLTEWYIQFPISFEMKAKPTWDEPLSTLTTSERYVRLEQPKLTKYYVFAGGQIVSSYESAAKAIREADAKMGVVVSSNHQVVWERSGAFIQNTIGGLEMTKQGNGVSNLDACVHMLLKANHYDVAAKGLVKKGENAYNTLSQYLQRPMSLKGCTLEEVLYFISGSKPVIAMTGNKTGVVIGGYTASKLILYNPQSGKTQTVSRSSYEKIFKDAGNYFISYMSES